LFINGLEKVAETTDFLHYCLKACSEENFIGLGFAGNRILRIQMAKPTGARIKLRRLAALLN
jgi:hypothetical protein